MEEAPPQHPRIQELDSLISRLKLANDSTPCILLDSFKQIKAESERIMLKKYAKVCQKAIEKKSESFQIQWAQFASKINQSYTKLKRQRSQLPSGDQASHIAESMIKKAKMEFYSYISANPGLKMFSSDSAELFIQEIKTSLNSNHKAQGRSQFRSKYKACLQQSQAFAFKSQMLKDLGKLYEKSEGLMDQLKQGSGIEQVKAKMHEALDAALYNSLKKVESVDHFEKHFSKLKNMNEEVSQKIKQLMSEPKEMAPDVMMEHSQVIFATRKHLEELEQFKQQKMQLKNQFKEIVGVLQGCVSMFFLDIMQNVEQQSEASSPFIIQPVTQTSELILYNFKTEKSMKQFVGYTFPKNFSFLNLKNTGILAGGWREGKEIDEFIEISQLSQLQPLSNLPNGKYGVALTALSNQAQIFIIGGYNRADLKQVDIFTRKSKKWENRCFLTTSRYAATCTVVHDLYVLVFGGYNKKDNYLGTIEQMQLKTGNFKILGYKSDFYFQDNRFSAVEITKGKVILFGGYEQNSTYEVLINDEGKVTSLTKIKGAHINHLSTHTSKSNTFKLSNGIIWACDEKMQFKKFKNNEWR